MRRDDAAARDSAARQWPPIARFIRAEAALGDAALARDPYAVAAYEVLRFGLKQAWACLFGAAMLAPIVATHVFYPQHAWLERYDVLFLAAVAIQILMLATKLETIDEAKVICALHVVGTVMELHKTAIGSWIYPGASLFHIAGVPLFTGFMYASVGSYRARVWRLFYFRFRHHPRAAVDPLRARRRHLSELHRRHGRFRHALGPDRRDDHPVRAHDDLLQDLAKASRHAALLGFTLVALFIWFAENIGTFTGTWLYPRQMVHRTLVPASKLTSWFLLMIVSYTMVAWINGITTPRPVSTEADARVEVL